MSTDWNVHCVDCNSTHTFDDANHQDELMDILCKNAAAIAGLAPLLKLTHDVELRTMWGQIDPDWFAQHATHRLAPISEYGDLLTQCAEYVTCTCGTMNRCMLDRGHDGAHNAKVPARARGRR